MKYLKAEFPIAIALLVLGLGFAFEHAAIGHGGFALTGLLLVILAAIIIAPGTSLATVLLTCR